MCVSVECECIKCFAIPQASKEKENDNKKVFLTMLLTHIYCTVGNDII